MLHQSGLLPDLLCLLTTSPCPASSHFPPAEALELARDKGLLRLLLRLQEGKPCCSASQPCGECQL